MSCDEGYQLDLVWEYGAGVGAEVPVPHVVISGLHYLRLSLYKGRVEFIRLATTFLFRRRMTKAAQWIHLGIV